MIFVLLMFFSFHLAFFAKKINLKVVLFWRKIVYNGCVFAHIPPKDVCLWRFIFGSAPELCA